MRKRFRIVDRDTPYMFPPSVQDWLPANHLARFVVGVVEKLDLGLLRESYSGRGSDAYPPSMMVSLLFYGYATGVFSSRKLERATYDSVAFRYIAANQHPDHDTIADFRKTHLQALAALFVDVLQLCQKAGLVKLGHISLDGTKVKANASKHKAMSYDRMDKTLQRLEAEVEQLLEEAKTVDEQEDARYGKGKRIEELPEDLRRRQDRIAKIKQAKQSLEDEAKAKAQAKRQAMAQQEEALKKAGKTRKGKPPQAPRDAPDPKAQRNFTDPESRIMKDGASKSFEQAYNCQIASDEQAQVIVGTNVTQETNDKQQVKPVIKDVKKRTGQTPKKASLDAGYYSDDNVTYLESEKIDGYIATGRQKHGDKIPPSPRGRIPKDATTKDKMARKLRTVKGRATYSKRKQIVEPVFGQIKEARGFRRFLLRGLANVTCEWDIVCLAHNLLKLFRSGDQVQRA